MVLAGGVAANRPLRLRLKEMMDERGGQVFYPPPILCTDNAAMIALVAALRLERGEHDKTAGFEVRPRWPLVSLSHSLAG